MTVHLQKTIPAGAVPITVVDRAAFQQLAPNLPAPTRHWLKTLGFTGAADSHALVPDGHGTLGQVFAGVARADHPFALAALPTALPEGHYRLADGHGLAMAAEQAS